MPMMQPVEIDDLLEVRLDDVELDGVHFAGERFSPTVVVRNLCDDVLEGELAVRSHFETTIGRNDAPLMGTEIDLDLPPGESTRRELRLIGAGGAGTTTMMGVQRPEVVTSEDGTTEIEPGDQFMLLASAVFWDRDFYRAQYLWPRRAQYLSLVIALLSAVLAGMILWLSV